MKGHKLILASLVFAGAAIIGYFLMTRPAEKQEFAYPAPRYPRYLVNARAEELLSAARFAVRQPVGRAPLGRMQSGQTVYVFAHGGQDTRVWEALQQAWAERGVEARLLMPWEVMKISEEEFKRLTKGQPKGNEGWKELAFFRGEYYNFFPEDVRKEFGYADFSDSVYRRQYVPRYLDEHPEVQYFYAGEGGGSGWNDSQVIERHGDKFMGNYIFYQPIDLLSKAAQFPADVWNLVEEKILRPKPFVSEVAFQDPEGTNLHWFLTAEEAQFWTSRSFGGGDEASNHISIYPSPLRATLAEGGVIVAHANHTGMYPTMKVYLDPHGAVQRIEGGGRLGELFKMLVNHPTFKEAKFPNAEAWHGWHMNQDGFATNPKFIRSIPALLESGYYLPNLSERNRAGVQHLAFSDSIRGDDPRDLAYAKERGFPLAHTAHMHVYFPTVRWKLRDTGEWITLAEKGYVTAFDDPEVRALASRYGDPDQIFRYEWIPSVPGINVEGNYERDFAPDPWAWMMAEWKRIQDGSYQYFLEDYTVTSVGLRVPGLRAGRFNSR